MRAKGKKFGFNFKIIFKMHPFTSLKLIKFKRMIAKSYSISRMDVNFSEKKILLHTGVPRRTKYMSLSEQKWNLFFVLQTCMESCIKPKRNKKLSVILCSLTDTHLLPHTDCSTGIIRATLKHRCLVLYNLSIKEWEMAQSPVCQF